MRSAASSEVEALEQFGGPLRGSPFGRWYRRADHDQVLGAGQVLVDRRVLAGEPDPLA